MHYIFTFFYMEANFDHISEGLKMIDTDRDEIFQKNSW
jgi:hypothetical protein